jgi:hypothetical protein
LEEAAHLRLLPNRNVPIVVSQRTAPRCILIAMYRASIIVLMFSAAILAVAGARAQSAAPPVSIVLPPRVVANAPATFAVLGADGHLVPGEIVDIGNGQRLTTDATGRASFTAPPDGAFIATASGVSSASLVDAAPIAPAASVAKAAPDVSKRDWFAICGGGFRGDVDGDHVTINDDPAFVLAASPECIAVLAQGSTLAGPAKIKIEAGGAKIMATTSLIALDFVPPNPPLMPGRKGKLFVRADGTSDPLQIVVENSSPDVIHFMRGETQQLRTPGSTRNESPIEVQAIRSGEFSFHARILPPPDPASAVRYLNIGVGVAPKNVQATLKVLTQEISRHPRDAAKSQAALEHIAASVPPGTLRTLLEAANSSL